MVILIDLWHYDIPQFSHSWFCLVVVCGFLLKTKLILDVLVLGCKPVTYCSLPKFGKTVIISVYVSTSSHPSSPISFSIDVSSPKVIGVKSEEDTPGTLTTLYSHCVLPQAASMRHAVKIKIAFFMYSVFV